MNRRDIPSVVTLLLLAVAPLGARQGEPAVPTTLSLDDAIRLATRNNPAYRQTANDRSATAWAVRNAYSSLFMPSVNASTSFTYSGAGSQRFLTSEFTQPSATLGSNYAVTLNWQIDGRTVMQPGVQRAQHEATLATIDAARMTLQNQVVRQYLAVLEARAQVELQERQVTRNEENRRLAQARFDVGQSTLLDVRQAEVAKGQSDVALLQARQLVTVETLRLYQQMGVAAPTDLSVVALSDSFPVIEPTWALDELLDLADRSNPDVQSLQSQRASARRSENATKSEWLPSFNFSAGWQGFTQQFTNSDFLVQSAQAQAAAAVSNCQAQNQINQVAGLPINDCSALQFTSQTEAQIRAGNSGFPFNFRKQPFFARMTVSLPLFDQFDRNLRISQASAQADDAREALRARRLQVRTDVSRMYYGVVASFQTIGIQETNRIAAREQLRLARERYRVGSGTFFELLDAQLVAQQAEADYITALYGYHRNLADLEAAVGQPLH